MVMNKVKPGSNMYQGFITHTWNPLGGQCSHECCYCYVDTVVGGKKPLLDKYSGEPRLIESEMTTKLGSVNTIFVQNMGDLFAEDVSDIIIRKVLKKLNESSNNTYLIQTKNPLRFIRFWDELPPKRILGTTIETNRTLSSEFTKAPQPLERFRAMVLLKVLEEFYDINQDPIKSSQQLMITIEPIVDFDLEELTTWIATTKADFVNVGADSKKSDLNEPEAWKIGVLIDRLRRSTQIKIKSNLVRIVGQDMLDTLLEYSGVTH